MKRLETGLIDGISYVYDESGKINWLKMIPEKFLYINPQKKESLEKRLNKKFEDITLAETQDTDQIITLQGCRYLLDLRGYRYAKINVDVAAVDYAAATCEICFIPNVEENFEQIFTANASAHLNNTANFMQNYLIEAASNRALCRAVRGYLKINSVSKEELGKENKVEENEPTESNFDPVSILGKLLLDRQIPFAKVQARLVKQGVAGAEAFESIRDIPKPNVIELIEKIKTKPVKPDTA